MTPLEKQLREGEYGQTYGPTRIELEAAERIADLEGGIRYAIDLIKGGYDGEAAFELDRAISETEVV